MNLRGNMNPIVDDSLLKQFQLKKEEESDLLCEIDGCKAGNKICSSLILEKEHSPVMPCDLCCAATDFCRECCCILCYKTLDSSYGGYSYIMCKVTQGNAICGHAAHLECAFRSYLAGTLAQPIGLDAEYLCRRCDGKTELISHADKLLLTCEAIDSNDVIKEKNLNLGLCLMCGSEKAAAKDLMSRFALAMSKLKPWTNPEDILNAYTNLPIQSSGVDAFRKLQSYEYKSAEETVKEQWKHLQGLSKQLEKEKSELANQLNDSHSSVLFQTVKKREEQLRQEVMKLEEMKKRAKGLAGASTDVFKHFGF